MREYKSEPFDNDYRYNNFIFITAVILWLVFTISPFTSYYLSLILLAVSPELKNVVRRTLGVLVVISGTVFIASRNYRGTLSDDITYVYFPVYRDVFNHGDSFTAYSGGWEWVLGGLFKVLSFLTDKPIDRSLFIFIFVFIPYLIYYIWLEKFGLEYISRNKKSLCVSASLGVMGLITLSIQIRQGLSTPILLLAISYLNRSRIKSVLLTALAISTHLTVIPIYFILRVFTGNNVKHKIIGLSFIAVLVFMFQFVVGAIVAENLLGVASFKFKYYLDKDSDVTILSFAIALLIMMIAGSFFFDKNEHLKGWRSFIVWGGAAYIILLPIPLASDRLFMAMSVFLMGYLLFLSFSRISTIFRALLILYFIFKFITVGPLYGIMGVSPVMAFWTNYDWIGDYPFYFWVK
ncbi:EpsG family protein [Serratia entomophila]|uniref:EpsG family protein n=1 Tax=Serratia entomophila TaxID=42906 RepID=UPI0021791A60|nr:EpsG family protein [Serratia entomophila]CAI0883730.1 Uncharacterised protein [Serratia entomophila]CAI0886167.1 Uncharacterised protein [Serratia entomophila]CAI0891568.1 Uncharacterised protein [Serratia entomophila]CAI1006835.1 Uncharacterised protein [Serratia entomophila]CAI1572808.1 Uncharacterised protein [Serratia entomophila]